MTGEEKEGNGKKRAHEPEYKLWFNSLPQSYDWHLDVFLTIKLKMFDSVFTEREFNGRCYGEQRIIHVI